MDSYLISITKINGESVKEIIRRPQTSKLPEENNGENLFDTGATVIFGYDAESSSKKREKLGM